MNKTNVFIRVCFIFLSALLYITYTTQLFSGALSSVDLALRAGIGLSSAAGIVILEVYLKRFQFCQIAGCILGLGVGYLAGAIVLLLLNSIDSMPLVSTYKNEFQFIKLGLFLGFFYLCAMSIYRGIQKLSVYFPLLRWDFPIPKRKQILLDWTILGEPRLIELAASGLLDAQLIFPRFLLKELYAMVDSQDEMIKHRAKRCLEILGKLEAMPSLELSYVNIDFSEIKENSAKLVHLAAIFDSYIMTAEGARLQPYMTSSVKLINIQALTNVLKPLTGEQLQVKIQRYGKEPRQGIGYLDDGTMVVVNGAAEHIGELVKAHVLSVKHTASGRMIFCNVINESGYIESMVSHQMAYAEELKRGSYSHLN